MPRSTLTFRQKAAAFFEGVGSIFNLMPGPMPPIKRRFIRNDEEAMAADWKAVGDDLRAAMGILDNARSDATPADVFHHRTKLGGRDARTEGK